GEGGGAPGGAGRAPARASGAALLQRGDLAPAVSRRVAGGAPRTGAGPGSAVSGERGDLARLRRRPAAPAAPATGGPGPARRSRVPLQGGRGHARLVGGFGRQRAQ